MQFLDGKIDDFGNMRTFILNLDGSQRIMNKFSTGKQEF